MAPAKNSDIKIHAAAFSVCPPSNIDLFAEGIILYSEENTYTVRLRVGKLQE